jgi:hypothetical protein
MLPNGVHLVEPAAGPAEAGHQQASPPQHRDHRPRAPGIARPATGFLDDDLDFRAAVETFLPDADQLGSLGYNAGAEPGTASIAVLTISTARCSK